MSWARESPLCYAALRMDILMVAAELAPYVRQTDAAEAVASLAKALRQLGHDVTVALPRFPGLEASGLQVARRLTPLPLPSGGEVTVLDGQLSSGVRLVLFDAPVLFERAGVYGEGEEDYPDNPKRFGLLSEAAAALVRQRAQQGQAFDVVHLHDWPAALVPLSLRRLPGPTLPSVLTIHDARRQGSFPLRDLEALGISRELAESEGLVLGGKINVLACGVASADAITTASPSYAEDMLREELSGPLAPLLAAGNKPLIGVTNGVDYAQCNPATDTALTSRYDAEDASNKGRSKTKLLLELDFELEPDRPLFVATGPLTADKGFDLLASSLPSLAKQDLVLVVAGKSSEPLFARLQALASDYSDAFSLLADPDDALLHRIYGAADFVLVPSRHEPCGTAQLFGQRYGALPVVSTSGGLKDTVVDCDAQFETGTGFVFEELVPRGLAGAVGRALAAYASPVWPRLRRRVMRLDLSWDRPARRYLQVYRQTLAGA
jgi:starch synthase